MRKRFVGIVPAILAAALALLCVSTPASAATGGNDFYRITVIDSSGLGGIGCYEVLTGSMHPLAHYPDLDPNLPAAQQNVLYGGGQAHTSHTTIRSYTSGADYIQHDTNEYGYHNCVPFPLWLEGYVAPGEEAVPIGDPNSPSGFRTTYRVGSVAPAPDLMTIVQEAAALGTIFDSSAAYIRTSITNDGTAPVSVGVRYLWDFQIGVDDGPTFQQEDPDGAVLTNETDFLSPAFDRFEMQDNNVNDGMACFLGNSPVPFYAVSGSVTGPAALSPTPPSRLAFVAWRWVSGIPNRLALPPVEIPSVFEYTPAGRDVATCGYEEDDSAVLYWWGDEPSNALSIPPGETVSVVAYIFGYLPGVPPTFPGGGTEGPPGDPTCSDKLDNDGDGLVDMDDPDCVPPANQPPDCSAASPSKDLLWPPNHKFKAVTVEGVTDPDGDPISITVQGIRQDEPVRTPGSGNTCPDAAGAGSDTAKVRVERSGRGDGRIYHIDFEAADGKGGTCEGSVAVCVPHDQSKSKPQCVDQGSLFDSTAGCTKPGKDKGGGKNK